MNTCGVIRMHLLEMCELALNAAFQIVLKRRAHMLLIASVSVQNIRQFVAVIAS